LQIDFQDLDNNGQVKVDLTTLTTKIACSNIGLNVQGKLTQLFHTNT